jgi:hypothetical protein
MRSSSCGTPTVSCALLERRSVGQEKYAGRTASKAVFRPDARPLKKEILIEFVVQGNVVKATAIDSASGMEASIVGPPNGARAALAQAAARKLEYVIAKRS